MGTCHPDFERVRALATAIVGPVTTVSIDLPSFQVGYAFNNALIYLKGGVAVTSDRFNVTTTVGNILSGTTGDQTRWGGAVGAGIEFGFAPNWSAALEYDHLFMQDKLTTFATVPASPFIFGTDNIRQDVDLVTVRVNYRFGGPVVARY